jgi:hypothetical protein
VSKVIAGVKFEDGIEVSKERKQKTEKVAA